MSDQGTAGGGGGPTGFESQMLASQPQSMEDLVAQAIPGSSGLQGVCIFLVTLPPPLLFSYIYISKVEWHIKRYYPVKLLHFTFTHHAVGTLDWFSLPTLAFYFFCF